MVRAFGEQQRFILQADHLIDRNQEAYFPRFVATRFPEDSLVAMCFSSDTWHQTFYHVGSGNVSVSGPRAANQSLSSVAFKQVHIEQIVNQYVASYFAANVKKVIDGSWLRTLAKFSKRLLKDWTLLGSILEPRATTWPESQSAKLNGDRIANGI